MKKTMAAIAMAVAVAFGSVNAEETERGGGPSEEETHPWRIILDETRRQVTLEDENGKPFIYTFFHDPHIESKMYAIVNEWLADETKEKDLWEAIRDDETLNYLEREHLLYYATRPSDRVAREYYTNLHKMIGYGAKSNSGTVRGTGKSENIIPAPGRIYDPENWGLWAFQIFAGGGHDHVFGTVGNDWIDGGMGDDLIHAGRGNDFIKGGRGHDTIHGGPGNDTIVGGRGDDLIYPGPGNDFVFPGYGADTVVFGRHPGDQETLLILASEGGNGDLFEFAGVMGNLDDWYNGTAQGFSKKKFLVGRDRVRDHMMPELNLNGYTFRLHLSAVNEHFLTIQCRTCSGSNHLSIMGVRHSVRPHQIEDGIVR